jgi:hypothetical protein
VEVAYCCTPLCDICVRQVLNTPESGTVEPPFDTAVYGCQMGDGEAEYREVVKRVYCTVDDESLEAV